MHADLTYCDFLVLAPLDLEINALKSALETACWNTSTVGTTEFPCVIEATISDPDVAYFRRHVVIVQLNYRGVLNASVDTAKVLELYEPGYMVSFGIAGSFKNKDAPIGAVVFATSLFYYEPSADKSNRTESRMDPIKVGHDLLNRFRDIKLDIKKADGPVASGENLIADAMSNNKQRILDTNSNTLAVEMEAAGVGRAVDILCPFAEFVVIKGISDLADISKNFPSEDEKIIKDRATAASNAACCLAQLMHKAPLRRSLRSFLKPSENKITETAMREAQQISDTLKPYGIEANYTQLYACLYGRRGPIPAYFHWEQKSTALHWIDFKILTALRALPREIVTPIPLVTIAMADVQKDQPWHSSVHQLLGIHPTTDAEIKAQYEEISSFSNQVGYTRSAENEIRNELKELQHTGRPEITLNLMRYMLGQFCHRRMFVFTWKSYRAKWELLSRALGTWFTIFEWETMELAGKGGKQEAPGKDLLIEPGLYASLNGWLATSPAPDVVQEFVDYFKCHQDLFALSPSGSQDDARAQLEALMKCWDKEFFSQT